MDAGSSNIARVHFHSMDEFSTLMYQAIASEIGIVVEVSDFNLARQKFYAARRKLADPALARLQFRQSPHHANQMLIVKGPENAQA